MNNYFEKLTKMAEHHLNEAKAWSHLFDVCKEKNDYFGCKFCLKKQEAHQEMTTYFIFALKDLHYVPGTWRQVWGQAR